jgi:hypothetical protein
VSKSKQVRGSLHHFAKLNASQVREIRELLRQRAAAIELVDSLTYQRIGDKYGVGKNCIFHLNKGNSWSHLPEE